MMVVFDPFSSFDSKLYFKSFLLWFFIRLSRKLTLCCLKASIRSSQYPPKAAYCILEQIPISESLKFPYLPYFAIHYVSAFSPPFICWLTELIHIIGHFYFFSFFFWLAFSSSRKSAQINILASESTSLDNQHEILHPWLFFSLIC